MSWFALFLAVLLPARDGRGDESPRPLYDSLPGDALRQLWSR